MQVLTNTRHPPPLIITLVSYILTCPPREGKSSKKFTGMFYKLSIRSIQTGLCFVDIKIWFGNMTSSQTGPVTLSRIYFS